MVIVNCALEINQEVLCVIVKYFAKNHCDVAVVLSGIAHIHQERSDFDQTLELYDEILDAGWNALGECHPEVVTILNWIRNFHFRWENGDDPFDAYSKRLAIEKKVLDIDHTTSIIVTLSNHG